MGKLSQLGAMQNKIENNEKLRFAKKNLSGEQFRRLYGAYRRLFWFQIAPVFVLLAALLLMLIFIPAEPSGVKAGIMLLTVAFFLVPFLPVWLVLSQFVVGKLWHRYSKWYQKEGSISELHALFQ